MSVTNQLLAFVRDNPNCKGRDICNERARLAGIEKRDNGYGWFTLRGMTKRDLVHDPRLSELRAWWDDYVKTTWQTLSLEEKDAANHDYGQKLAALGVHQYVLTEKGRRQLEKATIVR